ncbi:hypothetical protein BC829DRAFT_378639 [Chytridium lagenaria]|nr:hypothetical protein BC829DRAFT_378639 [Chytridium lagenaria]
MLMPVTASPDFPLSFFLGIAGMPGFTAYAGLLGIGKPVKGETLYIGKALGLRVVGSAGTDEKVEYLRDVIKVDEAFNYKTVENLEETLGKACPAGIDIYFENVGGEMIPVCGMISQYNTTSETAYGVKNLMQVIGKRLVFQGFIISDSYGKPIHGEFMRDILKWIKEGSIVYKETVTEGIENTPDAFVGMLKGENFGKAVVKVADAVV